MATQTDRRTALETFATEGRSFPPPKEFAAKANVRDPKIYERADRDFEGFWAEQARTLLWRKPFTKVLEWEAPYAKWFIGGELNISENCLDRHVKAGKGSQVAYYWEGEPGDSRKLTFKDLLDLTCRAANALKELGVRKGDRVAIYMPMIPELPAAMLACARIGAPFTVVFGGFSAEALAGRINDSEAKVLVTADGGYRKGNVVPLKKNADDAVAQTTTIEKVLVVKRTKQDVPWTSGRDMWWHEIVDRQKSECPAESLDSEHMLYLLYTSGTTAKPKGIVHTTAGYLAGVAATHKMIFDVKDDDVYWCAADIGWVTGHSYIVFAPLANGTTGVIYEGVPDFPDKDRWWSVIEKYKVSILYCAPTAIRTFMKWGSEFPEKHDVRSLRLLGTVGEPINPEAWLWYHENIGGKRCPIVDTWWMTETGMILINPLPGLTTCKPGSATFPFPGVKADVLDEDGKSVPLGGAGYLVITARNAPRHLQRRQALSRNVLEPLPGEVSCRRWGAPRQGRLFLAHGPGRRRDEDLRSPYLDDGGRIGARVTPEGRRSGRDRPRGPGDGSGDLRLRHAPWRQRRQRGLIEGSPRARGQGDRLDRSSEDRHVHARASQDPLGKDHASAPPRYRQRAAARRHDHTRGRDGRRLDPHRERFGQRGVILSGARIVNAELSRTM